MWVRTLLLQALVATVLCVFISQATIVPRELVKTPTTLTSPVPRQELKLRADPKPDNGKPKPGVEDPKKKKEGKEKKDPKKKDPKKKDPKKNDPKKKPTSGKRKKAKKVVPKKSKWKCSAADVKTIRDPKKARKIWLDSKAGDIGDDYINKHGLTHWVQDLDQKIFKKEGLANAWNCYGREPKCELDRSCIPYEKEGYAGAYILFYSLQQLYAYLNDVREHLQDMSIKLALDVEKIHKDFSACDGGGVNIFALLSSSLGIDSAATAFNPVASATAGLFSGLSGLILDSSPKPKDKNSAASLAQSAKKALKEGIEFCDKLSNAVFGKPGAKQNFIPKELQQQSFKNAAIKALGNGQWLVPDPVQGLKEGMDMMYFRMDRVILRAINNDIVKKMWDKKSNKNKFYKMDRLETYRNAVACWEKSGGRVGPAKSAIKKKDKKALPECYFGIAVAKGKYDGIGGGGMGTIKSDKFIGYQKGEEYSAKMILDRGKSPSTIVDAVNNVIQNIEITTGKKKKKDDKKKKD
ncbi:hypothetical protein AJ79_00623 [Helicocarpus griseus UAMH5409]|uniref:Uncharacterized protein n=1 Tax=Helicocarpus griseus UAMH5409 TaxID=1447875 RepID=A0A2B7Y2H5_9EURO|nr:hypothetical protein AJ79_00623 [Helicocarpus griseus UAMH5409]